MLVKKLITSHTELTVKGVKSEKFKSGDEFLVVDTSLQLKYYVIE